MGTGTVLWWQCCSARNTLMHDGRQCPYMDKTERTAPEIPKRPPHRLSYPQPPQTLFLSLIRFISSCLIILRSVFALFNVQLVVYFGRSLA